MRTNTIILAVVMYLGLCVFSHAVPLLGAQDYWSAVNKALDAYSLPAGTQDSFKPTEPPFPLGDVMVNAQILPVVEGGVQAGPMPEEKNTSASVKAPQEMGVKEPRLNLSLSDDILDPQGILDNVVIDVLELKDMNIQDVLKLISQKTHLNIIAGKGVDGKVTIYLKDVKIKDALRIILDSNDLAYRVEDGILRVLPAAEFESRYGTKFGGRTQTRIFRLKHTNVNDVIALLEQVKSSSAKIIPDIKSNTCVIIDSPPNLVLMEKLVKEIDVPVLTEVFELNYASAKDISEKIQELLTEKVGQVKADERSNKLIVTDTDIKMPKIAQFVKAFDVKEQQVLIEAKILQVVLSDQNKFGIDWDALVNKYHDLALKSDFDILSSSEKRGTLNIGTLDADHYYALLQALETVGDSNILSSPSITSLNNQEAKILVGSTQPYVTTTTTTTASGPTTTAESVNFIEVGVKLFVTPIIHKDGFITMKIRPEVSSVTSMLTTSQNNTVPVVDTSEAETNVMVKDGVTIVIGGLIKDEEIGSVKKVPILGDVPLLGAVFQNRDKLIRKTEIVIFLTPKIISGDVSEKVETHL